MPTRDDPAGRPTARGAVAAGLLLAVAGCGVPAPAAPPVPAGQVQAVATQTRPDQAAGGRFEVTITNTGGQPFTVTSVQLDSPGFARLPPAEREEPFPPGITYDMPAPYGEVRCQAAAEPAHAVVRLHRDGGPSGTVRVPLASPDGLLARIHTGHCAARELARQVQVSLVDLQPGDGVLRAALRLRRGSWTGPVTATELRDSVLYAWDVPLPAMLPARQRQLDLPVQVRPATCSGHVIAETKQPYLFPLFLRLGEGEPRYVQVPTTEGQRAQLADLVRAVCPAGPAAPAGR